MVLKQQNAKKGRKYAVFEATAGAEKACGYAHGIQEVESLILFVSTKYQKTLKLCGFKVFLLPKYRRKR